jgi:hypothetical protein
MRHPPLSARSAAKKSGRSTDQRTPRLRTGAVKRSSSCGPSESWASSTWTDDDLRTSTADAVRGTAAMGVELLRDDLRASYGRFRSPHNIDADV